MVRSKREYISGAKDGQTEEVGERGKGDKGTRRQGDRGQGKNCSLFILDFRFVIGFAAFLQ
jgi:hypothetical protein